MSVTVPAQDETPFTQLFDTLTSAASPLSGGEVAARTGWRLVPEEQTNHVFSGDAVMLNDKLTLVIRRAGPDAEAYARTGGGMKFRARIGRLALNSRKVGPLAVKIIENNSGSVMLEVVPEPDAHAVVRYRLTTGESIIEARSSTGTGSIHALSQTRHVVVPDYFGDDMVFDATASAETPLPAENFCLNLIEGGNAMIMIVWQSNEQETRLSHTIPENGSVRAINTVLCQAGKSVWFAFFETPGIWRAEQGVLAPGWRPAFPGKWRSSLVRKDAIADSWDAEDRPGPSQIVGPHQGPLVIYPIDRSAATPLTTACPTDVMRNTLGVGPCQYILACEGLGAQGDPTPNSVMNWVEKQFEQRKEKKTADEIRERLEIMTGHVSQARTNLLRYAHFSVDVRARASGNAGADASSFLPVIDDLDRAIAKGLEPAASPELAKQLASEVTALIGKANSAETCAAIGARLRALGAAQDGALARSRMCVRRLRAQGRANAPVGPPDGGMAQDICKLADGFLRTK